jgi:hypothetical protein
MARPRNGKKKDVKNAETNHDLDENKGPAPENKPKMSLKRAEIAPQAECPLPEPTPLSSRRREFSAAADFITVTVWQRPLGFLFLGAVC